MPLSRYQIRNEYSLADPELYRAADKDDPEALLEGVAMAGLVGVLRQLGDLAEFAAELFHDLHEEVMVTAARGHSLIVRVQQLEAEIPAVEKAFLSQTSHSSFLYNPGIGWHPKMYVEQSLVMRGDLPRFIMESYEECRGPPRLFLLDKFDVAGAGACLKRYTDPSFFKLETSSSGTSGTDIQRERKIRKAKKKGSRWRNGETPEVLPMSHAKLHQLFLEERIENGITDPARRVKLRKRLNGFPFDTKSGKSYMDRFLKSPSPDHIEVHDIPVDSSPLLLPPNGNYEPVSDIANIKTMAPEKKSKERLRSLSPVKERTYQIVSATEKLNEIASGTGLAEVLTSNSGLQAYNVRDPCLKAYNVPSTPPAANSEKVIPVDGGSSESVDDYQSDDIASEVEHYMDALTTIESEIDTDTEFKAKNNLGYFSSRKQVSDLDVIDNQFQTISSESQSVGNSTLSDDGNSSLKKGISSFSSSDTHSPAAPSDGEVSSIVFPCNHQIEANDTSIAQLSVAVKDTASQAPGSTVSDGASSTGIAEVSGFSSELVNLFSVSSPFDLAASHTSADSLETGRDPVGPETNKRLSYISLNTATTNTVQEPARDNSPSRICCNNQFMNEFEVENYETGQNLPDSSCPFGPSNSKDESSLKEMLDDYDNNKDIHYPNPDENVASVSCFLDPADATDENVPILTDLNEKMDEVDSKDLNFSQKASLQSNLSDVSLRLGEDSSPEMSGRNVLVVEFGSIQPNPIVEIATDRSYGQSLNGILEARSAEDYYLQTSDEGQIGQQRVIIPFTEKHHLDPVASDVDNISPSTGEMTLDATSKEDIASESVEYVVQKVVADLPSKQLKQGTSDSEDEHFERASDTEDAATLKREGSCDMDLLETDRTSNTLLVGENFAQMHFKVSCVGAESLETTLGTTAKKDISGELVDNVSEIVSDLPFVCLKHGISGGEEEHFEWPSDTEDAALQREAGCNLDLLEMDSVSNPSFLGENVQVHLAVPSVAAGREGTEDADGSSTDLKNLVEVSLPAFEDENIGLEAEKASPLDEPRESGVADNVHQEKLAAPDSVSALIDADDYDTSGRERSDAILDRYFASDNMHSDKNISVQSSAKRCEWEASFAEENVVSLPQQLDEIVPSKVKEELITKPSQMLCSEETNRVTTVDASSEPMLESLCSQPLVPECLSQGNNDVDVPEQSMDLSTSILSNPFLLSSTSQVLVEEMPPLPPLPPVQWRMTKLQHALPAQGRLAVVHNAKTFPPLFQSREDQDTQPLNVVMVQSNLDHERPSLVSEHATEEVTHSSRSLTQVASVPDHGDTKVNVRALEQNSYTDSFLHLPGSHDDILPYHFRAQKEDEAGLASVLHLPTIGTASENYYGEHTKLKNQTASGASSAGDELRQKSEISEVTFVASYDTKRLPSRMEDKLPQHAMLDSASWSSVEKSALYTTEVTRYVNLEEERIREGSALPNVNVMTDGTTSQQPSKTKTDQPQLAVSTMESLLVWPAVEDDHKENGSRHIKLPRPRNPLIDAVVAHDKSMLRKVTEHARPEVQKVDDRDSILEQIRTKSFNLKPAVVSRPSIQGPATNLKVAAILEKAKTIRQAFAGSDEDEDNDSWSDS